jgi:hypothetical protein
MTEQHPFKWRHFQADIILLYVRWYLRYSLSYRDLEAHDVGEGSARGSYHDLSLGKVAMLPNSTSVVAPM